MKFDKLVPIRNVLRRAGLLKVVRWRSEVRVARRRREYLRQMPKSVLIDVHQTTARLLVGDAFEYARALSWQDDAHLLEAVLTTIRPGDSCWDVGANVGLYSVVFAAAVGSSGCVISFEPEPRSNRRLTENIHTNGLHNIRVFDFALGSERSRLRLNISKEPSSGLHSLQPAAAKQEELTDQQFEVDVWPGDQVLADYSLPVPTFIKIDVEGAEEHVIGGIGRLLQDHRCTAVLCEVHFALLEAQGQHSAPSRIVGALSNYGFGTIEWLDRSHLFARKQP